MTLPVSPLARICDVIREHINTLGKVTSPSDWDIAVTIGAPGVNLATAQSKNTLNLFFYRFEPFAFAANALPGDVQWMKVLCVITAFGIDEGTGDDSSLDFSVGFNELCMLSQVMRLFQEQPVMLINGDDDQKWHLQFIARPFNDEQINQIWSSQGDTIYRPSIVYEIALAPIIPEEIAPQAARVASIGLQANASMENTHMPWPADRETRYPVAESITVNSDNSQWAPAIVMLSGLAGDRKANLSLHFEVPNGPAGLADFSTFPAIEIWIAGDTTKNSDLTLVGQLLQNPDTANSAGSWHDISAVANISADTDLLDMAALPDPAPAAGAAAFVLRQAHWTDIDAAQNSWQVQLFAERYIKFDAVNNDWADVGPDDLAVRIRSNPVLITITRAIV
ncbi:MAG: hypothetical protein ACJAZP_001363 [Psychromonas sp.]|jgi:hypothetical protein|uniref:Pvc16 family protein n=1 Tax=Psychromonas sp. TaxID=1884585 RepID=UPI0039E2228B